MRLTPLDIRNHRFSTRVRGLDPAEVEAFVRLIAEDYEDMLRENEGLHEKVERLEVQVLDSDAARDDLGSVYAVGCKMLARDDTRLENQCAQAPCHVSGRFTLPGERHTPDLARVDAGITAAQAR